MAKGMGTKAPGMTKGTKADPFAGAIPTGTGKPGGKSDPQWGKDATKQIGLGMGPKSPKGC